jgi:hypothetical protein
MACFKKAIHDREMYEGFQANIALRLYERKSIPDIHRASEVAGHVLEIFREMSDATAGTTVWEKISTLQGERILAAHDSQRLGKADEKAGGLPGHSGESRDLGTPS